jgi:hypothetical protein
MAPYPCWVRIDVRERKSYTYHIEAYILVWFFYYSKERSLLLRKDRIYYIWIIIFSLERVKSWYFERIIYLISHIFFLFHLFLSFCETVLLFSPDWPATYNPPTSTSLVLASQLWILFFLKWRWRSFQGKDYTVNKKHYIH